jgi:hypothetical protein
MKRRGYTLTEAVIASFVLVTALLIASRLFHASLQYSAWVESKAVATYLAENRMAELRRWARTQTDWAGPPTGPAAGFSKYSINVLVEDHQVASPSIELEQEYALVGDQRLVIDSVKQATVEVRWDDNKISLVSLLREPTADWKPINPIVISGAIPSKVTSTTVVLLEARGYDDNGEEIDDLFFTWSVEPVFPGAATGTVTPARDGRSAEFRNQLNTGAGPIASTGRCRVVATAVYAGEERQGFSADLSLQP